MQQLINHAATHPGVRSAAVTIIRQARVGARDRRGELRSVFNWAKKNIRFTDDPYNREMVSHPLHTLETRAGDCDDYVVLMGGMLKSLGRPVRIVTIRADRREPGRQSHVFLQAQAEGEWITLDPTVEDSAFGWTPEPLYGPPLVWREMAAALPAPRAGLGRFVGLGQGGVTLGPITELPQPFPTNVTPETTTKQALLQTLENFASAGAARLAYGQQGASTAVTTQAAFTGSGGVGTSLGTGLGISSGVLLFAGLGIIVLLMMRRR